MLLMIIIGFYIVKYVVIYLSLESRLILPQNVDTNTFCSMKVLILILIDIDFILYVAINNVK